LRSPRRSPSLDRVGHRLVQQLGDREVVGVDCVELAPQQGMHAADFAVAKLLYKTMTYAIEGG
jgi:arginase family enzyme